jgi:uncharacterized protein with FMN-binding domain
MRRVAFAVLSTIAGLVGLLSFKTQNTSVASAPAAISTPTGSGGTSGSVASSGSVVSAGSANGSATSTKSSAVRKPAAAAKAYTGSVVETQYGPVQVRITVANRRVANATAIQYPSNDPRSQQINAYAVPVLEKETVGVTSANINMVSGATYTSTGYLQSLQSALNEAGL